MSFTRDEVDAPRSLAVNEEAVGADGGEVVIAIDQTFPRRPLGRHTRIAAIGANNVK